MGAHPTRQVFLVGFMGAGKTSVGKALARRLGWSFLDLDDLIEAQEKAAVRDIFTSAGEPAFRRIENAVLNRLLLESDDHLDTVIALGGGAFAQPGNREVLQRHEATTILLHAPVDELKRRCQTDDNLRPLAQNLSGDPSRFEELFANRRPAYDLAKLKVETSGKTIEEVAGEIEQLLKLDRCKA